MKNLVLNRYLVLLIVALAAAFFAGMYFSSSCNSCAETVDAHVSPGAAATIIHMLQSANESIELEMYEFTYKPLMDELAAAQARGVNVRVILEPRLSGDYNVNAAKYLEVRGVPVRWASLSFSLTHSKLLIVDDKRAFVGSPNWSYSALFRNRETAVLIEGGKAVSDLDAVFEEDWITASPT